MSNRFKFRAWDKVHKDMILDFIHESDNETGLDERGELYIEDLDRDSLDDFILMQYIGRKDKNGKEICKGDIITGNLFDQRLPTKGEVVYDHQQACYANKNLGGLTPLFKIDNIEIIGNIYENPELIK